MRETPKFVIGERSETSFKNDEAAKTRYETHLYGITRNHYKKNRLLQQETK